MELSTTPAVRPPEPTARFLPSRPNGQSPEAFAELTGLEVHALAIDIARIASMQRCSPDAKIYRIDKAESRELFFDAKGKVRLGHGL